MKRPGLAFAAALLLSAPPAWAQAGRVDDGKAITSDAIGAQASAYGQWLQRLTAAQMVGLSELQGLRDKWQEVTRSLTPGGILFFRVEIAKARAAMLRSDALLKALDRPKFPLLDLSPELLPDALIASMLSTSAQALQLVDSFGPMLDGMIARDGKAVERAAVQMLAAAKILVDSQALLGTAMLATVDKETPQYEAMQFDQLLYRSAGRILDAAGVVMHSGTDPKFRADIMNIATQIDGIVARGNAKADASIADQRKSLEDTGKSDAAVALLLRKSVEMDEIERRTFVVARDFAAALRALPDAPLTFAHIQTLLNALRVARLAADAITIKQNEILARER